MSYLNETGLSHVISRIKTELNKKADTTSVVQPDWNQNDETAPDYVKNRPFYEIVNKEVYIENQTITSTVSGNYAHASLEPVATIPWDGIVTIIFDGVTYDDIAAYESGGDMCVYVNFETENGDAISICESRSISMPSSLAGSHTIEVFGKVSSITPIDKKFLPSIAWEELEERPSIYKGDGNSASAVQINFATATGTGATGMNGGNAQGYYSVATGYRTSAVGQYASSSGNGNQSSTSKYSTSMTEAEVRSAWVQRHNVAFGQSSHTEGSNTLAYGNSSHAEGVETAAIGAASHAEGVGTIAKSHSQHVQGRYNVEDDTYAHIVGNGASDNERSNAHTVDWNGNAWYQGDVYVGSTSGTDKDDGSKKLATEEYVDGKIDAIVGEGASETLDTIGEIAAAIEENQDIITTLNSAIGSKANASDLTSHTNDKNNPHGVTLAQLGVTATAAAVNEAAGLAALTTDEIDALWEA